MWKIIQLWDVPPTMVAYNNVSNLSQAVILHSILHYDASLYDTISDNCTIAWRDRQQQDNYASIKYNDVIPITGTKMIIF